MIKALVGAQERDVAMEGILEGDLGTPRRFLIFQREHQ